MRYFLLLLLYMYSVLKIFFSGGFSQGGHLSLHAVYSHKCQVGGVFGIGSFLSGHSSVFDKIPNQSSSDLPPLFLSHGSEDDMVQPAWVEATRDKFRGYDNISKLCLIDKIFRSWCHCSISNSQWC